MRRLFLVLPLVVLGLLPATPVVPLQLTAGGRSEEPVIRSLTPGVPLALSLFYHPPNDGTSLETILRHAGSLVLTRGDEWYRDRLRAAGFRGPVLQYLSANEALGPSRLRSAADHCGEYDYAGNNLSGIAGDFCSELHWDESNFLHNGRGERLYWVTYWEQGNTKHWRTYYLMNPASPRWQAYFVQRSWENLDQLRYSGLFLDNLDAGLLRALRDEDQSDGVVAEYSSREAYREAVVSYLNALRTALPGVSIWANVTNGEDLADDWDAYLPYLDGAMDEYFIARSSGRLAQRRAWEAQVDRAERVLGAGKVFLGVGHGAHWDRDRMRFALASYLLIAQPRAGFRYSHQEHYGQVWLYDEYHARLGDPQTRRYQKDGLWRRDFECGYVTVDVAGREGRIVTDRGRHGCL